MIGKVRSWPAVMMRLISRTEAEERIADAAKEVARPSTQATHTGPSSRRPNREDSGARPRQLPDELSTQVGAAEEDIGPTDANGKVAPT